MRHALIAFAGLLACMLAPASASAQHYNSYVFRLNGEMTATNPEVMSGPYGCRSNLQDIRTGRLVCPGNMVATPDSVWRQVIARHCGVLSDPYGTKWENPSSCIGGIVAVGRNCPQNPGVCRYFRVSDPFASHESWTVRVDRIHQLGNELWIARPNGRHWGLYSRCYLSQFAQIQRYGQC